jgi:hypothetical protein
MPWKSNPDGGFEFIGKITDWLRDFRKWHVEDTKANPAIPELAYIQYVTLNYASLAKGKWQEEWLGKRKAARLDSFVTTTPQGNIQVSLWDTLDFLAENIDDGLRMKWSSQVRRDTKRMLKLV